MLLFPGYIKKTFCKKLKDPNERKSTNLVFFISKQKAVNLNSVMKSARNLAIIKYKNTHFGMSGILVRSFIKKVFNYGFSGLLASCSSKLLACKGNFWAHFILAWLDL